MKRPYDRIAEDRYSSEYVICDKYDETFDDPYHIDLYGWRALRQRHLRSVRDNAPTHPKRGNNPAVSLRMQG